MCSPYYPQSKKSHLYPSNAMLFTSLGKRGSKSSKRTASLTELTGAALCCDWTALVQRHTMAARRALFSSRFAGERDVSSSHLFGVSACLVCASGIGHVPGLQRESGNSISEIALCMTHFTIITAQLNKLQPLLLRPTISVSAAMLLVNKRSAS